jgi:hypothetical protein
VILKNSKGINTMKKTILTFLLFAMVITISSCGGGGGGATGGNNSGGSSNSLVITVTPVASSLPANTLGYPAFIGSPFQTQVNIRVAFENGQGVATGTIVHLQTSDASIAFVGIPDDPTTTDVDEFDQGFVGVNQETIGSNATYYIRSDSTPGTVTFTANATHPTNGRNFERTFNFTVTAGPDPTVVQLDAVLPRTTLPVNSQNTAFFQGTPFMMEADIQVKDVFGNFTSPVIGASGQPEVNVSITPANVLYFTPNDDIGTVDVNEFIAPELTQGVIQINSGRGNLFLWSRNIPGTATVTLSAIEAGSGLTLTQTFSVTVVDDGSDPGTPTSVVLNNGGSLYINGSGGATSQGVNVTVSSGTLPVLDPQVNNVNLTLLTDSANSGEKLSGTNASGSSVQGTNINVATVNGIANAIVSSGNNSNTITVRATVDRADNNVSNGIQDGISTVTNYIVSDGVLWALDLTTSALDTLTVNGEILSDPDATQLIYDFQDGTYSLLISAIGTDKAGNPALPQTLQFGMINSPLTGYPENGSGSFVISGVDGNPQEGGSSFTSIGGSFITAAQGVQVSDTLLVFGEESLGNEDLESAVSVSSVNSQTNLTILERFNRNDETGSINNDGGVLPYAIGRAVDGNISATAVINDVGVASTRLNYPVSQLGRLAAIYVKGQGPINNNIVKSIVDVSLITFPGVSGFNGQLSSLTASPGSIPGNSSNIVISVCLRDSAQNPLPGRFVNFSYTGEGTGIIDGVSNSGTMSNPTGFNGCAVGLASTTGVLPGNADGGFNFVAGGITCDLDGTDNTNCIDVIASTSGVLNANPSSVIGSGSRTITLTLYDGSGNTIEGAPLSGSCTQPAGGSLGIISGLLPTNANGTSVVTVSASLDAPNGGLSGACTFATASGSPSVVVNFSGGDACVLVAPSPLPPGGACPP